jgi:hypothetical protein
MSGMDAVLGMPSAWALGYAIGRPGSSPQDAPTAFGVGGVGGSFAYGDTESGIAFGIHQEPARQRLQLGDRDHPDRDRSHGAVASFEEDHMRKVKAVVS